MLHFIDYSFGSLLLHEHDNIEVMLILDGSVQVSAEGQRYSVPRNGLVVMPPHVLHRTIILKETKRYDRMVLHIFPEYLDYILPKDAGFSSAQFTDRVHVLDYSPDALWIFRNLYERAFHAQLQTEKYQKLVVPCLAVDFFTNLRYFLEVQEHPSLPVSNHLVSEAINCINEHFMDPDFSVEQILEEIHVSQGYLSRLFKAYTGGSIYRFILGRRLFYAKDLLVKGASVQDAFLSSGFTDYTSFLKAFKRQFQTTPSQFRKINRPDDKKAWAV